jgi:hypothetical protein
MKQEAPREWAVGVGSGVKEWEARSKNGSCLSFPLLLPTAVVLHACSRTEPSRVASSYTGPSIY